MAGNLEVMQKKSKTRKSKDGKDKDVENDKEKKI